LSWTGEPTVSGLLGPLAIVAACVAWGLDNNLTRKVSLSDRWCRKRAWGTPRTV